MINPIAERLTGWRLADARDKPLEEIFRIVNEQTRETVESPVVKVLREGGIVGLANHTVLIHRAGYETAIEDSGAPILDDAGAITGVVLVFRDATEERAAKNALCLRTARRMNFSRPSRTNCAIRWHRFGKRRRLRPIRTRRPSRSAGVTR